MNFRLAAVVVWLLAPVFVFATISAKAQSTCPAGSTPAWNGTVFVTAPCLSHVDLNNALNYAIQQGAAQSLAPAGVPASGKFYADQGAVIRRFNDRLFVGAAGDNLGVANRDQLPRDWLSTTMGATSIGAYPVWGAQGASLARYGSIGWLAASRTSDAQASRNLLGYTPSSIGTASWAIDDDKTAGRTTTAYAYYGEAWKLPGVSQQPSFVAELEVVDIGGGPVGSSTTYHPNTGGGGVGLQLGAGGGQAQQTWDAAAGIVFVNNPSRFQNGLIFGADSLTGVTSSPTDAGFATAIRLARNQALVWDTPETSGGVQGINYGLFVRSTVTKAVNATRIEAQDTGLVVSNSAGNAIMVVETAPNPTSYLVLQTGSNSAPGLYAGGAGSANLGLYPQAGGELQISSPISNSGGAMPATAAGGFLHLNINGVDWRVPLVSPTQAGG